MLCYGYVEMSTSCEKEVLVCISSSVPSSSVLLKRTHVKIPSPLRNPKCVLSCYMLAG